MALLLPMPLEAPAVCLEGQGTFPTNFLRQPSETEANVFHFKKKKGGWSDGSVAKSTDCSFREPRFYPQHPHGGSQPSVAPDPGDPMASSGFYRNQTCTWHMDIGVGRWN